MGQLEKYGLYVMCLVIFLILGVTLWGEPANATRTASRQRAGVEEGASGPMEASFSGRTQRSTLDSLLQPVERPAPSSPAPQPQPAVTLSPEPKPPEPVASPAAPKPEPRVEPSRARTNYVIKKGDDMGKIAQQQLGSAKFRDRIQELNPDVDPNRMQIGASLILPARAEIESARLESPNKAVASGAYRLYRIRKGDSFEKSAKRQLGARKRWTELRKMNPNVNPNRMQIGVPIKLPLQ